MSTIQQDPSQAPPPATKKTWVGRHKILTSLGILIIACAVAFYFLGWPLMKWRFHSLFASSLDEIRKNPTAVQRLGEPISVPLFPLPNGRVYTDGGRGDARFDFSVVGSKDKAQAVSLMRMIDGQWGFTQLELEFPDHQKLDLTRSIEQSAHDDTPKFDPNAKQPSAKAPNLPVDISLPDMPGEQKK